MTYRNTLGHALSFALGTLLGAGVVAWRWQTFRHGRRAAPALRPRKPSDDETPLFI